MGHSRRLSKKFLLLYRQRRCQKQCSSKWFPAWHSRAQPGQTPTTVGRHANAKRRTSQQSRLLLRSRCPYPYKIERITIEVLEKEGNTARTVRDKLAHQKRQRTLAPTGERKMALVIVCTKNSKDTIRMEEISPSFLGVVGLLMVRVLCCRAHWSS